MKVISVVNTKGGTGKSTIAINLAVALANQGKKIMLLDTDTKQQSSVAFISIRNENQDLKPISAFTVKDPNFHRTIDNYGNFDYVIIDAGAGEGALVRGAILCSNRGMLVIPVQAGVTDLWGTEDTLKVLADCRSFLPGYDLNFIVYNRTPTNVRINFTRDVKESLEELLQKYDTNVKCMHSYLSERTIFKASIPYGMGIEEYGEKIKRQDLKAVGELNSVVDEVLQILGKKGDSQ